MTQIKACLFFFFLCPHRKQSVSLHVQDKVSNEGMKESTMRMNMIVNDSEVEMTSLYRGKSTPNADQV